MSVACAPTVQRALAGPADAQGPHFDVAQHQFVSFDGAVLGLSSWAPANNQEPWAVIIGLHGMNDYGEAFFPAGPWFAERGIATYAYDARGFGRSPMRGLWPGPELMREDLRAAIQVVRRLHPNAELVVMGDSMGAASAIAAYASDDPPPEPDRLILVAPAVWGWSSLPDMYALTLWTGAHTLPWRPVSPPRNVTRRIVPSDNVEMLRRIGRDQNLIFRTRIDALYGLVGLMDLGARGTAKLHGNVAFLYGAHDQVIPRSAAIIAAERLPAGARTAVYANGYHMLLRDLQAEVVYEDVLAFIRDPAAPFPSGAPPLERPQAAPTAQANR